MLNIQIAAGAMFSFAYLTHANGLPLLGCLLGLVVGGELAVGENAETEKYFSNKDLADLVFVLRVVVSVQ